MAKILIARKQWKNAAAFIEVDDTTGMVSVYGKIYEDDGISRRGYPGPETKVLTTMPVSLLQEANTYPSFAAPKSPEMEDFLGEVWKKAKEENSWFSY